MNIDELQEFLADNINSDVPVNTQNQLMSDAEKLDFASFQKKWDKFLQDNSAGWSSVRSNTKTTKERVKDAFGTEIPSENWLLEMHEKELSDIPIKDVRTAIDELQTEKEEENEKQKIANEYKREAETRFERQKAVDNYKYPYLGLDDDNPINRFLNGVADILISDDTRKAIIDDPNNNAGIIGNAATDIVGTGADIIPGYGALIGTGLRTARDIVNDKDWSDIVRRGLVDAAIAGGPSLWGKLKGVKRDVDAVENASSILDNLSPEAKTASDYIKKGKEYDKLFEVNVKKTGLNAMNDDVMRETFANMSKEDFALYKAQLKKKNPKMYDVIKDVKYENRADGVLDAYNKKAAEGASFADNELVQAKLYKKQNPKKYAAYKVAKGIENKVSGPATKISLHEAGEQKKPRYTKDVINYIIDTTAKQWEAGFIPTPKQGIVYEAYKKWESEK